MDALSIENVDCIFPTLLFLSCISLKTKYQASFQPLMEREREREVDVPTFYYKLILFKTWYYKRINFDFTSIIKHTWFKVWQLLLWPFIFPLFLRNFHLEIWLSFSLFLNPTSKPQIIKGKQRHILNISFSFLKYYIAHHW